MPVLEANKITHIRKVKIGVKQAKAALEILKAYGRQAYCPTAEVTPGECICIAIARLNDTPAVVDAAIEMLEDWNGHLSVAAISAIEKGHGKVERKGRKLTITLPEWWASPSLNPPGQTAGVKSPF
jgi:hypothetical protein